MALINKRLKIWMLIISALVTLLATFCLKPIAQNASYHAFADTRRLLTIPNCLNVVSNVFFLFVGVWGWRELKKRKWWNSSAFIYLVMFLGIFLTGLGSAYYHLSPNNDRLIWDRIPMTI